MKRPRFWLLLCLLGGLLIPALPTPGQVPGDQASGDQASTLPESAAVSSVSSGAGQPDEGAEPTAGGGLGLREVVAGNPLEVATWTRLVRRAQEEFLLFLPNFLYALIILVVFYFLFRGAARLLSGIMRRTEADPALREIGTKILRIFIFSFGLVMAAGQLGFEIGSLLAGIGVLGLAVGLAAQETLANFIAGLTILWDRPFRIGDNVTIAGTFGTVEEIGLRSTRIRTVDERDAMLPNKDVINEKIINHTLSSRLRLDIPVGIGYGEDTRKAREVLLAAVEGHPMILTEPAPKVVVAGLGDSSVDLELRVWLADSHQERRGMCEFLELAKLALDEAGIEIPFPQRTLHLVDSGPRGNGDLQKVLETR